MKKTIRSFFTAAISLATLLITGSALAAVNPTAVFSNFTGADTETGITVGGYTLKANGNTVDAHGITISTTSGVTLEPTSGNGNVTVIVRYSGFPSAAVASDTALISASIDSGKSSNCGMAVKGNDSNKAYTYIGTGFRTTASIGGAANPSVPTAGRIALSYCYNGGTAIYVGPNDGTLEGGRDDGFKWGGSTLGRISIGASLASTWPATGMKIEEIAVIAGTSYRDASGMNELAAYKFPSETAKEAVVAEWVGDFDVLTKNGLVLNLNGSAVNDGVITVSGGVKITKETGAFPMAQGTTIIAELSDIPTDGTQDPASARKTVMTTYLADNGIISIDSIEDGKAYQDWCHQKNPSAATSANPLPTGKCVLAMAYEGSGNASTKGATSYLDGALLLNTSGLVSTKTDINALWIGSYSDGSCVATGMKVSKIAVFGKKLSAAEVAAYQFPVIPIKPGSIVTWSNTGSANEVTSGYKKSRMKFMIPATAELPAGSVVNVKTIRLASTAESTTSVDQNKNPQFLELNHIRSGKVNGNTGTASVLFEDKKIAANVTTSAYALEYSWSDECLITVGELYGQAREGSGNQLNDGLTCLHNNGNTLVSSGNSAANVMFVHSADANSIVFDPVGSNSSTATPKIPTEAGYYPVYEITAEVISNPACETVATVTLDSNDEVFWSEIQWEGGIAPSATIPAEITVNNNASIIMDGEVVAKSITFKGTGVVGVSDNTIGGAPTYNVGKIVSEITIVLGTESSFDVDAGANDLTYEYSGTGTITPTFTCTGALTIGGGSSGTVKLSTVPTFSSLDVKTGTVICKPSNAQLRKPITIRKGATWIYGTDVNQGGDSEDIGSGLVLNIYGKFISNGRFAFHGTQTTINLYAGGEIAANVKNAYGNIDMASAAGTIHILPDPTDESTVATVSAPWRLRTYNMPKNIVNVPAGLTLEITGELGYYTNSDGAGILEKTGDGTLIIKGVTPKHCTNGLIISGGTLVVEACPGTCPVTMAAGTTLDLSSNTGADISSFITGNLTIDAGMGIRFPAEFAENRPFTLCGGTLAAPAMVNNATVYVGDVLKPGAVLMYDATNMTVSYMVPTVKEVNLSDRDAVTIQNIIDAVNDPDWTSEVDLTLKAGATLAIDNTPISYLTIKTISSGGVTLEVTDAANLAKFDLAGVAGDITITTATALSFDAGSHNLIYNYTGSGEISPTIATTGTLTLGATNNGVFALTSKPTSALTINQGATVKVMYDNRTAIEGVALSGEGTIIFDANAQGNDSDITAYIKCTFSDAWEGVFWLKNCRGTGCERSPWKLGTANSVVRYTNCSGWTRTTTTSGAFEATVDFEDSGSDLALIIENGSSGWAADKTVVYKKFTGTGTFKYNWSNKYPIIVRDLSEFNGTINMAQNSAGLTVSPTAAFADLTENNGKITIAANGAAYIASGKTWNAVSGIDVNGTIGGAGILGNDTTFGAGATLDCTKGTLSLDSGKTATFGSTLNITGVTAPAGDNAVKVLDGTFATAKLISCRVTIGGSDTYILEQRTDGIYVSVATEGDTYTFSAGEQETISQIELGGLYSTAVKQFGITKLESVPAGYFAWAEGVNIYAAKKSNSISIKLGTRTADRDSRILTTDTNVGGFPVAGKFWNVAKVSNGNAGNPVSDYTTLLNGNNVDSGARIAYYAVNTYYAAYSPTSFNTGNERLLGTYFDDGDVAKATTWTINESSDGTEVPEGGVTLPATPNNRGWEVQISDIPYDMYDLYVYVASDQPEDGLKACPVTISVDNGTTWAYYAGEAAGTDSDYWSPQAYSHDGVVTEGKNYIRFRVSKNTMKVDDISTVQISHGTRNTGTKKRLGLAGIQIVEIDDDGMRDRKVVAGDTQKWHDAKSWVLTKQDGTTVDNDWVDSTSSNPITARIDASTIPTIVMDSDATVDKLVITGAADTFTIAGEAALTATTINATEFAGNIVFDAPVTGALSLGENAKLVVEIDDGEEVSVDNLLPAGLTIASGNITIIGSGTLVCDGKVPDAYATSLQNSTWTGTVWIKNILVPDVKNLTQFGQYKNTGSKVCLTGVRGWLNNGSQGVEFELKDETVEEVKVLGLEIQDSSGNYKYVFPKFTGTGSFKAATISTASAAYIVTDVSEFNGALLSTAGTLRKEGHASDGDATNPRPIFVGYSDVNEVTAGTDSLINIKSGTTVNAGCGWEAASVVFGETLTVKGEIGDVLVRGVTTAPTALPALTDVTGQPSMTLKYENNAIVLAQAAASFNGKGYATFAEAITAANASDEGGTVTIYANSGDLTVEIADGKTITIACAQGIYVGGDSITKTGAGTLVLDGASASLALDIVVEEGELVLTDNFWLSGGIFAGEDISVAPGATIEFRNNNNIAGFIANFIGTEDGFGTVRKSGTGTITMSTDVFANFGGDIEFVAGGIISSAKMSINKSLKIAGEAMVGITPSEAMTERLTFAEGATLDISEWTIANPFCLGIIELPASVKYVFPASEQPENGFKIVNGALAIDADVVNNAIISINGVEYLATLTYSPDEQTGDGFVKYSNKMPIIRIVESMTSAEVNAKIAEIGMSGFATVYFEDEAELEMTDALSLQLAMVCAGNAILSGTGTINAGSIAFVGSTKTLDIGENVIFVPAIPDNLSTATITGEGTIVYDGALPGNEKSSYQSTDNWTGTVWLKNYNYQRFDFGALGHSGSKVALTHILGYSPNDATSGANPEIVLVDEGSNVALEINDGHGGSKYFFRKLSGDGTFKTSGNQGTNSQYRFYDVSDFEGTFALNGNNKRVVIGTGSTDAGTGQILIDNTATVAIPTGKTWSANNGITVDGAIAGAGILGSNTTFGNGATIDASATQLTVEANKTLTFGSSLTVKLASAPTEDAPVKFLNGSFTEQTFETTLTVMVNDQPAEGDFAIKQDANGVWAIANTEVVWTGAGENHNWSTPANWQGSVVPAAGRNVVIDVGEATDYSIVIDSNTAAIGSLTVTGAGVVFSGEGTINGPITFTTPKIAGSLKAVGDVTVGRPTSGTTVDFSAALTMTGNLTFNRLEPVNFNAGTDIDVTGNMTITSDSNDRTYFNAGEITVSGTLATKGGNPRYARYHFGDGSSDNSTMVITANKIDAASGGTVFDLYNLYTGATLNVGTGGLNLSGHSSYASSFRLYGGKYVATGTSTISSQTAFPVEKDSTIEVVDGATLTINNSGKDFGQAGKKITKTGAGTLKFAGTVLTAIDVTAGAVEMTAGDEAGVTVSEGADLYLKVTAEQKEAGYTSTATIPTGTNISFILPNGTVVEGVGGILPPKTIAWIGADQGSWDDPSNWSPAVVPLVDSIVSFAGEGEGTITIKISDGTRTIEGVSFNSSKNIAIDGVVNVTGAITKDGTGTLAINLGADNSNAIAVTAGALEVNVPANTTRVLSGAITGSGMIVKSGEGALHINRANNTGFTGSWEVLGGDLKGLAEKWCGADNNNTPIVLTVNDGATLHLANMGDFAYSLVCNGGTVNNDGNVTGNRYTTGCRQAKNITINGDTIFTGNQFGVLASGYNPTTMTFNDNATLTLSMNANSAFFMTATTVSGAGTIKVAQGIFSSANNTGAAPVINEGVKVVVDGGTLKADKNTLTIHTLEYVSGSFTSANNAAVKVTGTLSGSSTIPRLTLGNGATIPVTSEIAVSNALALDGSIVIDLGTAGSGNFRVITAPNGYEWDTTNVTLSGSDITDWNVSAEGTTLVVSKLPLDATVDDADGYNFGEKIIEVDVKKIDSTLTGTQIKVVTTDKNGNPVSTTLVPIDGSKGKYEVTIGGLTAGNAYNFNVTFVDSEGNQIEQSKEADLENIAVGTLIEGVDVFSADASKDEGQREVGGEWDKEPTITDGKYVIDDETASVFGVTDKPTGNYTIEYELTFEAGFTTELTDEESAPIAGLTISKEETDETTYWYRANGTGWSKLDREVTPGHYIIRMAFTDSTVTYSVKDAEDPSATFTTLSEGQTTAFTKGAQTAIQSVSFLGSSSLAKFGAKTDDTIDPTIALDGDLQRIDSAEGVVTALLNGKTVTLKTNVAIDTAKLAVGEYTINGDFDLSFVGTDTHVITFADGVLTIAEATISNGQSNKVNQDLNLDPTDEDDIPFVKAINSTNPNAITFKLFHGAEAKEVATDESANENAKFFVESCDNASFTGEGVVIEKSPSAGVKETLDVPLPTGTNKVRYYRLKFNAK